MTSPIIALVPYVKYTALTSVEWVVDSVKAMLLTITRQQTLEYRFQNSLHA